MHELERQDLAEIIMHNLPPSERNILTEYYYNNKSFKEIGEEYKVGGQSAANAVRSTLKLCRKIASQLDKGKPVLIEPVITRHSSFFLVPCKRKDGIEFRKQKLPKKKKVNRSRYLWFNSLDDMPPLILHLYKKSEHYRKQEEERLRILKQEEEKRLYREKKFITMAKINNFQESLRIGKVSENALMDLVRSVGKTPVGMEGLFKGYDFFVCETKTAYEVKRDYKSVLTGNVVIETEMPVGTPSGLKTTFADYWIFDLYNCYVFIRVSRLRDLVWMENLKLCEFVGNGDTTKKAAYLAPIAKLHEYANNVYWKK